jgi:GAF domain-containing protein
VFAAVTEEVDRLLRLDTASMSRYEDDGTHTLVAISGRLRGVFHLGQRWKLGGRNVSTLIFETGHPARLNSYSDATGTIGVTLRELDLRQAVGAPIIVEDRLWGSLSASLAAEHPLPADTEARLASFTELVATAIANADRYRKRWPTRPCTPAPRSCRSNSTYPVRPCGWRSATTGSAAPTQPGGPG